MLTNLIVQNYALLDEVNIEFSAGLNILTGETGSGKSILIGALELILGSRATKDAIRSGMDSATVEGLFEWKSDDPMIPLPEDLDIEMEDRTLIIRRDVTRDGRSRCTVNGHPVTVTVLKRLGEFLVDLHGQHDHQSLLDQGTHINFLDGFGDIKRLKEQVAHAFRHFSGAARALKQLDEENLATRERRELYQFQLEELEKADVYPGEEGELEQELAVLEHAEQLIQVASTAYEALSQREGAVIDQLIQIIRSLEDIERIDVSLSEPVSNARSARYYLDDVVVFLQQYRDRIEFDPVRLDEVQERLEQLKMLKRKYGGTLKEVCVYRDRMADEINRLETADEQRSELEEALEQARKTLTAKAEKLSTARKKTASRMETRVVKELTELGMKKTRFQVHIGWLEVADGPIVIEGKSYQADASGMDHVEFLISPNQGEELKPLVHIASGGEISRVMLALKVILAESDQVRTLVFDEVDLGIGGRIAESIGQKLKLLSQSHQVLCITHLHQVACWGHTHFTVHKESSRGRTVTQINHLDQNGRVQEIARMLAGETVDDMAVTHAREILRRTLV
ncbi:MAG: DNA repair protein RecN [Candidatus Latescibacteria bacterium]|nr:DNA repair protein RecN [Candidatus Latescibacterota bacterium]